MSCIWSILSFTSESKIKHFPFSLHPTVCINVLITHFSRVATFTALQWLLNQCNQPKNTFVFNAPLWSWVCGSRFSLVFTNNKLNLILILILKPIGMSSIPLASCTPINGQCLSYLSWIFIDTKSVRH